MLCSVEHPKAWFVNTMFASVFWSSTRVVRRRLLSLNFVFFILYLLTSCSQDKVFYSQVNMVPIYSLPELSSMVVAKLSINMKVEVLEKSQGWLKVSVRGISGWAPNTSFATKPLTLQMVETHAKSVLGREKIGWLEKVVDLNGSLDNWHALKKSYTDFGLTKKAKYVDDVLKGNLPVYLSKCTENRQLVVAVYEKNSGLKNIEFDGIERVITALDSVTWYGPGSISTETIFHKPTLYINDLPGEVEEYMIEVGKCWGDSILSTVPIDLLDSVEYFGEDSNYRNEYSRIQNSIQEKTGIKSIQLIDIAVISDMPKVYQVRFEGNNTNNSVIGVSYHDNQYNIVSSNILKVCKPDVGLTCEASVSEPDLTKIRFGSGVRISILDWGWSASEELEMDIIASSRSGFWITIVDETGKIESLEILTGGQGA